jgi:hypothetical protein
MGISKVIFHHARPFPVAVSGPAGSVPALWWRVVLVGVAVIGLAACPPVLAGIGAENPLRAPNRPDLTCSRSTESTRQLAMIDSTSEGGFQCLGVLLEGQTVKAIRLEAHRYADTRPVRVTEFSPTIVGSNHGAVLDGIPGYDSIILRGNFATPSGKPELELSFLYNGFTGEYRTCQMSIDRTPDTGWRLVNSLDQPVSHIVVRIRQLPVIGMVGIADLEGACASHAR